MLRVKNHQQDVFTEERVAGHTQFFTVLFGRLDVSMIHTIIFATDLGCFTPHAMHHVVTLATSCRAKVIVVHAVEPLGDLANAVIRAYFPSQSSQVLGLNNVEQIMIGIKSKIRDILADEYFCNGNNVSCIADIRVVQGTPAKAILEEAQGQQADLIVMGSHGPNAADNHMLGSVTSKVLQRAKIPVYMVPMMNPLSLQRKGGQLQFWQ